jgi:hypothetical protein
VRRRTLDVLMSRLTSEVVRREVDAQDFVIFNYRDGGRKGTALRRGPLDLDVKRMELAYHENNKREYELTQHISLRRLAPAALLALKTPGTCQVMVPQWVFDLDTPGHCMRRIRSVSITIPCTTGTYTSLNCTLTVTKARCASHCSPATATRAKGAKIAASWTTSAPPSPSS